MVKKTIFRLTVMLLLLWCFPEVALAEKKPPDRADAPATGQRFGAVRNERGTLWVSTGHQYGNVTYQIGGRVNDYAHGLSWDQTFPTSELTWPLNTVTGQIGAELRLGRRGELRAFYQRNLTGHLGGKVEDSDWLTQTMIPDIYSESETDFEGMTLDAGGRFWFLDRRFNGDAFLALGIGAGLMYQNFKWEARNLDQWYPTRPEWGHDYVAGPIFTYQTKVWMPYAEIVIKSKVRRFDFAASVSASPWMQIQDKDNHLLRAFIAKADTEGFGVKMAMEGNYHFTPRWFAGLRFNLLLFETKGVSTTIGYAGASAGDYYDIEEKITSFQLDTMLTAGFRF
ncbi:MAG: omptin family outer membrane protease [Smithellaceae bacterium]